MSAELFLLQGEKKEMQKDVREQQGSDKVFDVVMNNHDEPLAQEKIIAAMNRG